MCQYSTVDTKQYDTEGTVLPNAEEQPVKDVHEKIA